MLTFLIPTAKEMNIPAQSFPQVISEKSSAIVQEMRRMTLEELAKAYAITEEAAKKEEARLQEIDEGRASTYPALHLFNGLMYRHIKRDLTPAESRYLEQTTYITSSFYGIIPVFENIAEHRHDFHTKMTIKGQSLKSYWREDYDAFAGKQKQIISLLSSEFEEVFSPSIRKTFTTISFMEEKKGQLKTHSTISKKARGAFLTAAVEKQVRSIEDLKALTFAGFTYQEDLSTPHQLVYTKKV